MNRLILATAAFTIGMFLASATAQAQTIWYVDDDAGSAAAGENSWSYEFTDQRSIRVTGGANDGSSWEDAFTELQSALAVAQPGDQIWVAEGTYTPDYDVNSAQHTGDREATFQLISGVVVYGGFDGTENTLEERSGLFDQTVLSGDLNWNDGPLLVEDFAACISGIDVPLEPGCEAFDFDLDNDVDWDDLAQFLQSNNYGENSYHVTTGSGTDASAVLDGFTISGGNANEGLGGSGPNRRGGGMFNDAGNPTVVNCTFDSNTAAFDGGGMANLNSNPDITRCTFSKNVSAYGGGLVNDDGSSPLLIECIVTENCATVGGGGIYGENGSSPTLIDCVISGNSAMGNGSFSGGGGMHNNYSSAPSLIGCTFTYNFAQFGGGGGVANRVDIGADPISPMFTECTFSGNSTAGRGGGMRNDKFASPAVSYCTFTGNSSDTGGGIFNLNNSAMIVGCAFIDNYAEYSNSSSGGGGMSIVGYMDFYPTVSNCLFLGNSTDAGGGGMMIIGPSPVITSCLFSGNSSVHRGGGIEILGGGSPRVSNCTFSGNSAGESGGGMYNENCDAPTVTNCTFSGNTAEYSGGGMVNYLDSNPTLTDCTFSGNTAEFGGGMVNYWDSSPTVTNCTFSGNSASYGGGMGNALSSLTVTNCTFSGNSAGTCGGGMCNSDSNPTVTNCTFSGNSASYGGGMCNFFYTSSTVTNCTFHGNTAGGGGGIYSTDEYGGHSTLSVTNCILWSNSGGEIFDAAGAETTVNYTDVQGGWTGPGAYNIDAVPLFVDADGPDDVPGTEDDNLRLSAGSPCIDAADNTAVPTGIVTDLDGNPRFVDDPFTTNTGNPDGINPIVDMGAYEYQPTTGCTGVALMVLADHGDGECSLRFSGNNDLIISITPEYGGAGIIQVNSDHPCAVCGSGSSLTIEADEMNIVGDACFNGNPTLDVDINPGSDYVPDPLASIDPPTWDPVNDLGSIETGGTYGPGYYSGGIRITNPAITVVLEPGVYIVDNVDNGLDGGLDSGLYVNGGNLVAHEVMFFIVGQGVLFLAGNGTIEISPPESGYYERISIFQARDNTNPATILGTSFQVLDGDYYFPVAPMEVGGTGINLGNQLIAWDIWLHGTGTYTIDYDGRFPSCPVIPRTLIIKQGRCPATLNPNSNGVVPLLLVGEEDFDVTQIDLSSLRLSRSDGEGGSLPPGPPFRFLDLNHPYDGEGTCSCNEDQRSDGIVDLSMKFRTDDLVDVLDLDELPGGAVIELALTGMLNDGWSFVAGDCIVIVPPGGTSPANAFFESSVADTFIEITPMDLNFDSDGFADFARSYYTGTLMTATVPPTSDGKAFVRWIVDGVLQEAGARSIDVTVTEDTTLRAFYKFKPLDSILEHTEPTPTIGSVPKRTFR